jgi:hypothetical protein
MPENKMEGTLLTSERGQNGPNIVWKKKRTVLRKTHFWFCSAVSGM